MCGGSVKAILLGRGRGPATLVAMDPRIAIVEGYITRLDVDAIVNAANETLLGSIAFPAISTDVYRFPADRAAAIAVSTVAEFLDLVS